MKFTELTVLLPCHSLEDFPVYHEGGQADELLAAWSALWHPALLASAEAVPTWQRVDVPPEMLAGRLIVVPPFCLDRLPADFVARTKNEGAWLVQQAHLDAAVAEALEGLDGRGAGVDEPLAADFLALGFCRLQLELLTRQMRYSTNIDETYFQNEVVAAAKAAVAHDTHTAREHLLHCFETLHESRKHFYPVDIYLLDLTLVAATTLAEPLRKELDNGTPTNLLIPTGLLQQLSSEEPATFSSLLSAIDHGTACVLGSELDERELPLLPLETALSSLGAGVRQYEAILGRRPAVYARRRAGLWPALPQLLVKFAFHGALHFTLDDGRFPLGTQCKTRWEGLDSSVLDVFARVPADAARPETFLGLPRKMADSMDSDHVATVAMAHWPLGSSPWHDMLRRIAQLSPVLGKFLLLDDYFSNTDMPGRLSKFEADEYRTPYLKQAVAALQSDAISKFVIAHRSQANRAAVRAVSTLHDLITGQTGPSPSPSMGEGWGVGEGASHAPAHPNLLPQGERESEQLATALDRLAAALPRGAAPVSSGYLVINPLSFARRIGLELPQFKFPPAAQVPVVASASTADRVFAVVEVPPMGFVRIEPAGSPPPASRAKPIAHENVLRNEFFEVTVGRNSGGIQSVYNFQQRGNQLSQQIAFRLPAAAAKPDGTWHDPEADAAYTTMRAESVEITAACAAMGEIVSRGVLLGDDGRRVAGFRQTTQVWSQSRVIRVEIELDGLEEPGADPWNSYCAARFAWPDAAADLWRGVGLTRQKTDASRLEAPEYIDIENGTGRISILTGGLPYHRRSDPRMLDSLLVVHGERARLFRFAIGVDLPQPAASAVELMTPTLALFESGPPLATASGWLFHVDAKNVVATDWQPLAGEADSAAATGGAGLPTTGFRARLLETAGRAGRVTLRVFRPVAAARQVDFLGQTMFEVPVDHDKITLDFAAYEWIEIEATWSR
jgi:alpha-mannosidase